MPPMFVRAVGLSASSRDLRVRQGLIKVAEVFVYAAQIHVGSGVIRFEF